MCGIFGSFRTALPLETSLALRHRGPDSSGTETRGSGTIGECRLAITGSSKEKPPFFSCGKEIALVHNGEAYNYQELTSHKLETGVDSEAIAHLLEGGPERLRKIDGPYSLAWLDKTGNLFLARDVLGEKPLFISRQEGEGFLFASERKALPPGATERAPPGSVLRNGKIVSRRVLTPRKSGKTIGTLLEESVRKRVSGLKKVSVSFSGGLDSSLVAMIAAKFAQVTCIVSAVEGSLDLEAAENAASLLGLSLRKNLIKPSNELFSAVSSAIETSERMQVEIATPLFCLAREMKERVLLTGQGADELFLGYSRYYKVPAEEAGKTSLSDIRKIGERNCERDDMAGMAFGVELRAPFLDIELVRAALAIPARTRAADPVLRKAVLRKAALEMGLPEKLALAPKKAIQYSSGIHRASSFGKE